MERKFINHKKLLGYLEGKTLSLKLNGQVMKMKLKDVDQMSEEEAKQTIQILIECLEDNRILKFVTSITHQVKKNTKQVSKIVKTKTRKNLLNFRNVIRNFIIKLKDYGMICLNFLHRIQSVFIVRLKAYRERILQLSYRQIKRFYILYKSVKEKLEKAMQSEKYKIIYQKELLPKRNELKKKRFQYMYKRTLKYFVSKKQQNTLMVFSMYFLILRRLRL